MTEPKEDAPYLRVAVSVRTPGGLRAAFEYEAEDAASGDPTLRLAGVHMDPTEHTTEDEARRLERLLRCALGTYNLSISEQWAQATRFAEPKVDD